jgi:hypothetical protein
LEFDLPPSRRRAVDKEKTLSLSGSSFATTRELLMAIDRALSRHRKVSLNGIGFGASMFS